MADRTVVFGDLVGSTFSPLQKIAAILDLIGVTPTGTLDQNTWGDAFVAVFDSANEALRYALKVRDRLRYFDWRSTGYSRAPLLRLALATGPVDWGPNLIRGCNDPEGWPFIEGARLEAATRPGDVFVTQTVRDLAERSLQQREFHFEPVLHLELPKKFDTGKQYFSAHWYIEREAVTEGRLGPLMDEQYYRRAEALRRFALLWLLLDQLPGGSWGRSIYAWMGEVWRDSDLTPNALIEDEGGFETTILNLQLLNRLFGPDKFFQGASGRAFEYLQKRIAPGRGIGPLAVSRQGYAIEPHPRHTALASWLIGDVIQSRAMIDPELTDVFRTGILALFGGDPATRFERDRNPLLLYVSVWRIMRALKSAWGNTFTEAEIASIREGWNHAEPRLLHAALTHIYTHPRPVKLSHRLDPLTVPYGQFVRMEAYSVLSAAMLLDTEMRPEIRGRIKAAIDYMLTDYLHGQEFRRPERRYSRDPLRPPRRGPRAYYAPDPENHPDLGTAAMLVRLLRSPNVVTALWDRNQPEHCSVARCYLEEDLVEFFDRYLLHPELFSLTHAGMFAALLDGDSATLLESTFRKCERIDEEVPPVVLREDTLDKVLSERRLEQLVRDVVEDDGQGTGIQLAAHSLTRLLLDKLRPGRYITEDLTEKGSLAVSNQTAVVYQNPFFVEKYNLTWQNVPDRFILIPFWELIGEESTILDVGCGPGQYSLEFAKKGHRVILLDSSQHFLQLVQDRFQDQGLPTPQSFKCDVLDRGSRGKAESCAPYHAIWCSGLFAHMPVSAQSQVLDWFRRLLRPDGVLFVNVLLDNPRVFARDGRYYSYYSTGGEFEKRLARSQFEIIQMLQRTVQRNTYREPYLKLVWENYYCRASHCGGEPTRAMHASMATDFTAYAYDRSVSEFSAVLTNQRKTQRAKFIDGTLNKLIKLGGLEAPRVLDAGCGCGDFVIEMARRGWIAVGMDISHRMIEFATSHCPENLPGRAEFRVGDFRKMPEAYTAAYDAVICITALQHVPHEAEEGAIRDVLAEFWRVLKPNGVLRIDVRLGGDPGYDPDLRFIQSFQDESVVVQIADSTGFALEDTDAWRAPPLVNTFKRPIELRFANLWLRKRPASV